MVEKTIPYNIEVTHVKGVTHYLADYLSRKKKERREAPEFGTVLPTICPRSLRPNPTNFAMKDPSLIRVT